MNVLEINKGQKGREGLGKGQRRAAPANEHREGAQRRGSRQNSEPKSL